MAIRVLLADDHPLVREGVSSILHDEKDIQLVGEAENTDETRHLAASLRPDVLILDLQMPGSPVSDVVAYLHEHCPEIKVLVLTAYDDPAYVRGLVNAGVEGYVLKDEIPEAIVKAIHSVAEGGNWYSQRVIQQLTGRFRTSQKRIPDLEPRELEVIRLMAAGYTDHQISEKMHMAERTVRMVLRSVYDKLEAEGRVAAAVRATELGIVHSQDTT